MIENKSLRSKIFDILNIVILIAITLICIVPVWYVLCVSLSSREAVNAGKVALWPVGFNLLSYKKIMGETAFFGSFLVSIKRVLLGTGISMVCILMAAYPLSRTKKQFPKRDIFMWIFVFCMLFNGGTVPWYITMKNYHLMDNIFGLVLGTGLQVFNVILAVNFFKNLPTDANVEDSTGITIDKELNKCGNISFFSSIVYFPLLYASYTNRFLFIYGDSKINAFRPCSEAKNNSSLAISYSSNVHGHAFCEFSDSLIAS